ncbi:MAG: hypothetical protein JNM83_15115 [Myxococcales bacterium]|jgi:hypothetical protein|nr:hypothetical protein [Myxococcales bacterium]
MRFNKQIWSGLLLWGVLQAACSPDIPVTTGTVSVENFRSALMGDDYLLRIRLPPSYDADPTRRYPLIVQLDPTFVGLHQFEITTGLVSTYALQGLWPEAIVVGPDYPDPFKRERDYPLPKPLTPSFAGQNVDLFYRVLRDEILPYVEGKLRVDTTRRVLVGHSAGATVVWYSTFRHTADAPPLFSGAIAADNGMEEGLFTVERWHSERTNTLPMRLFATRATYNGVVQEIPYRALCDRIRQRNYQGLTFAEETMETDHGGAVRPSFEHGLDFILGGQR